MGARPHPTTLAPARLRYTPGVLERKYEWERLAEYPASLRTFQAAGYQIWHLFGTGKGADHLLESNWSAMRELPPLAEVTDATIRAEEVNARNLAHDQRRRGPGFAIPWDLHPKSLHAEFAHNTDLLLTLQSGAVRRSREVGISERTPFGLGGGMCAHVLRDGTAAELIACDRVEVGEFRVPGER